MGVFGPTCRSPPVPSAVDLLDAGCTLEEPRDRMVDHASEVPRLLASRKPSVIVLQESGILRCLLNAIASSGKEADVVLSRNVRVHTH